MCARFNTNLLKRNKEQYEKRRKKKYLQDVWNIINISSPALAYGIIFVLQSIINESVGFSISLAVFSICVTVAFEFHEWRGFFNSSKHRRQESCFNNFPLLFALILLIASAVIYNVIFTFVDIPYYIMNKISNIISSISLLFYFISYTARQELIRKHQYLDKEDEYKS